MKDAVLFLPGRYPENHWVFYRKLCRGKFKIAVDGGFRFFRSSTIIPDMLIGDFDSLGRRPSGLSSRTAVVEFKTDKDKTDTQLAVEYCLDKRAAKIDIIQPTIGQPDHFMANLMLLSLAAGYNKRGYHPDLRLLNYRHEIRLIRNQRIDLKRAPGDHLSIVPLSDKILLSCKGTAFDVSRLVVKRGTTASLRNRITKRKACVEVRGEAWLFISDHGRKRLPSQ